MGFWEFTGWARINIFFGRNYRVTWRLLLTEGILAYTNTIFQEKVNPRLGGFWNFLTSFLSFRMTLSSDSNPSYWHSTPYSVFCSFLTVNNFGSKKLECPNHS